MLEKVFIFILFLGPLIFFHELGHFFFARLFGVRVEVFSIGFGPKILKYVHKGTQYAISVIPLGGYVKMFGDDPFSETQLSEEEKKVAFNHKSKFARFCIVFGGPLANLILAYFLYVGLLVNGEKVPETKLGVVAEQSVMYEKGIRTGDILVGINDEKVLSFDDLNIKGSSVENITVKRGEDKVIIPISMDLEPFINEFISLISALRRPIVIDQKGNKFYLSSTPKPTELNYSFEELKDNFQGSIYLYSYLQEGDKYTLDLNTESLLKSPNNENLMGLLQQKGYYPAELTVKNVVMGSPADKAGIKMGDILTALNGQTIQNFEQFRKALQQINDSEQVKLIVVSGTNKSEKVIAPEVKEIDGKKTKLIGVESAVEYLPPKLIEAKEDSIGSAVTAAFSRTWDGIVKTFSSYKKLFMFEVSMKNIGGPFAIGKVASDSFNISLSMFFRLMAIISINLGVINLFPIPVLDGGHIMFLVFELVNGGPLSRRKLEIAQRVGVSVLFFLIFIALFNDFTRFFRS
jgi:regulator of sigma E protease